MHQSQRSLCTNPISKMSLISSGRDSIHFPMVTVMHIKGVLHNLGQNLSNDYTFFFLASTSLGDFKELPLFMGLNHLSRSFQPTLRVYTEISSNVCIQYAILTQ